MEVPRSKLRPVIAQLGGLNYAKACDFGCEYVYMMIIIIIEYIYIYILLYMLYVYICVIKIAKLLRN